MYKLNRVILSGAPCLTDKAIFISFDSFLLMKILEKEFSIIFFQQSNKIGVQIHPIQHVQQKIVIHSVESVIKVKGYQRICVGYVLSRLQAVVFGVVIHRV
jgi:hypothetical protein